MWLHTAHFLLKYVEEEMHLDYVKFFFPIQEISLILRFRRADWCGWLFIRLYCFLFPPLKQVDTALSPSDFRKNFIVFILRYDDITLTLVNKSMKNKILSV